ncbi:Short-chain dehydrogenase/reductase SDR [Penicillium waksmanii]|uniref:Short-chain dehydrogenase/reductase SDR n=1 Tax=Penicillium waksmanii TaxID=69791 RepID=UPI002547685F|nr:Short-chain dehydrogenase/reductase SDR [Penicillium waksmanii]KAJ5984547.1 Short-chain dehydrogenase/reductase SDR [Penicillium waksmanii]
MAFPPSAGFTWISKTHNDSYPTITASKCKQQGRAVFVTGASKGIGRAVAVSFAQAGASSIALGARSSLDATEAAVLDAARTSGHPPPKVLKLVLDVSDEQSVADAAAEVERDFGRLDVLVNNAGRVEKWVPLAETDPKAWWGTWEVNIKGTYLMTRAMLPLLLKGGERTIVNMNSIGAHLTRPGASAYQTGKLAMLRLTQFTCVEYAAQGILAFAIHPGAVDTELASNLPEDTKAKLVDSPELCADTIVWLTQERQLWLAGRYLSANWDMAELMCRKEEIIQGDKLKVKLVL